MTALRWCGLCVVCCAGLLLWSMAPTAEARGRSEEAIASPLASSLVTPASPLAAEQAQAQQLADLSAPGAVAARRASRTAFRTLSAGRAREVAQSAFPAVVNQPSGGPPTLPHGQHITGFKSRNVASLDLGSGRHGLVESLAPMARESAPGHLEPINLALVSSGDAYVPAGSDVPVRISRRLGDGMRLSTSGVSLTPVDSHGSGLSTEGAPEGASVFYPNSQTDSDTLAKPTSLGFEISTILRSSDSPHTLYYRVGMPSGAHLREEHGRTAVVLSGQTIATILPVDARDAVGTQVPVTLSVSHDILIVEVSAGEYQYPIAVDPSVTEQDLTGPVFPVEGSSGTRWREVSNQEANFRFERFYVKGGGQTWTMEGRGAAYVKGEYVGLQYVTQGESRIYKVEVSANGENVAGNTYTQLEFYTAKAERTALYRISTGGSYNTTTTLCVNANGCEPANATPGNIVQFVNYPTEPGGEFIDSTTKANVYISQEKAPEATFNESEATLSNGRKNALYLTGK